MKIKYIFANDEVSEIEVSEKWNKIIIECEKEEYNSNHKLTRSDHKYCPGDVISFESLSYKGEWFLSHENFLDELIRKETCENVRKAIEKLRPEQKELIIKIFFENRSLTSVAKENGVSIVAIHKKVIRTCKELKNFLCK